ncbi:MAG: hypothetical protein M1814_003482 [Vezdaea aestivalis]|nr:MAG: hypothetical protein M1814_003482 [Vezdaea aestivalis]
MWPRYLLSLLLLSFPIPQPRYWIHLAYCEVFGQECSEGSFPNSTERAHVTTYEADHHHPTLTPRASRVKGLGFTPGLWDSLTMRACTEALEPFRKAAATPSGLAMCYNLPFLDNSTGVFQSELRIFRVTDPSGLWIAINESSVRLGLSFPDATIQASTVPGFASTAPKNLVPLDDRAVALRKRREEASILHIFHFVGQLSKDVMERPMTLIMLRGYVAPQVTVGASTSGDIQISDLLSLADASFVSGELPCIFDMPTSIAGPGDPSSLQNIADSLAQSKKIVLITGAGISTNCGIPDFRSENGLYTLIQSQYALKARRTQDAFLASSQESDSSRKNLKRKRNGSEEALGDNVGLSCFSQQDMSRQTSYKSTAILSRTSLPPNMKGKDLFDARIWSNEISASVFYTFIASLKQKIRDDVPSASATHQFIRAMRDGGRLVRCYTQNIDGIEGREGLCLDLGRGKGNRARLSKKVVANHRPDELEEGGEMDGGCEVVQLHGDLDSLRCTMCQTLCSWDEEDRFDTLLEGLAPTCQTCVGKDEARQIKGRRGTAVGYLRPNVVLYGEEHPSATAISEISEHDISLMPDALIIMGTSLRVHGLKFLVREFAKVVHSRAGDRGKVIFVNNTKPSESMWGDFIDHWVCMDCDEWVEDLKNRRNDLWARQGEPRMPPLKPVTAAKPIPKQKGPLDMTKKEGAKHIRAAKALVWLKIGLIQPKRPKKRKKSLIDSSQSSSNDKVNGSANASIPKTSIYPALLVSNMTIGISNSNNSRSKDPRTPTLTTQDLLASRNLSTPAGSACSILTDARIVNSKFLSPEQSPLKALSNWSYDRSYQKPSGITPRSTFPVYRDSQWYLDSLEPVSTTGWKSEIEVSKVLTPATASKINQSLPITTWKTQATGVVFAEKEQAAAPFLPDKSRTSHPPARRKVQRQKPKPAQKIESTFPPLVQHDELKHRVRPSTYFETVLNQPHDISVDFGAKRVRRPTKKAAELGCY